MNDSTILVCGGGPVGLVAALELASHGVRPGIIDSNQGPTDLSKALVVWRRTLKSIDGLVPFERFLRDHVPMRSARIVSDGRAIASIDLTEARIGETAFPTGVLVPQSATERILLEALAERDVEVERRTCLVGLAPRRPGPPSASKVLGVRRRSTRTGSSPATAVIRRFERNWAWSFPEPRSSIAG